ncbi:amidohydrolase family protein [Candidatus Hydrogenedentota bacterium]
MEREPFAAMTIGADIKAELMQHLESLEIIDSHEHLRPERERVGQDADVLTLLSLYGWFEAVSAGMPVQEGESGFAEHSFLDTDTPLEDRWARTWPYIQNIKFGDYYRPTAIAIKDIYGFDDLNESNYVAISERIQVENKPGLYKRILRERARIKTCLVQNRMIEGQDPPELFTPVFCDHNSLEFWNGAFILDFEKRYDTSITDLDTYLEVFMRYLAEIRNQGAVGFKSAAWQLVEPDMETARKTFASVLQGGPGDAVLKSTILDAVFKKAEEWDWPIPVHCGVWNDYRIFDPKNMIDTVMKYPNVRFNLYHLGMPYVRDCIFIAKNFPNVFLDLCWCYVVSQNMTRRAINEILDTVPVNKVIGFGGDYVMAVENVYGHLVMARETMAEALSERILRGKLDVDGAKRVTGLWLHDNPCAFYGLR